MFTRFYTELNTSRVMRQPSRSKNFQGYIRMILSRLDHLLFREPRVLLFRNSVRAVLNDLHPERTVIILNRTRNSHLHRNIGFLRFQRTE